MAKFSEAIAYSNGVILCRQYTEIHSQLPSLNIYHTHSFEVPTKEVNCSFRKEILLRALKSSKVARDVMEKIKHRLLSISPRYLDVNAIENIFHIVCRQLHEDALNWLWTLQFSYCVKQTLKNFPVEIVNT